MYICVCVIGGKGEGRDEMIPFVCVFGGVSLMTRQDDMQISSAHHGMCVWKPHAHYVVRCMSLDRGWKLWFSREKEKEICPWQILLLGLWNWGAWGWGGGKGWEVQGGGWGAEGKNNSVRDLIGWNVSRCFNCWGSVCHWRREGG